MVGDASVWAGWEGRGQVCRACGGAAPAAASPSPRKTLALSLLKVDSPCSRVCVSRWLVVPWARRWRSGAVRRVVSRDASERRCDTHPGSGRKRGERSEKGQREGRERRASILTPTPPPEPPPSLSLFPGAPPHGPALAPFVRRTHTRTHTHTSPAPKGEPAWLRAGASERGRGVSVQAALPLAACARVRARVGPGNRSSPATALCAPPPPPPPRRPPPAHQTQCAL